MADLVRDTELSYVTCQSLIQSTAKRIDLETLDRLCTHFGCQPGDLFEAVADDHSVATSDDRSKLQRVSAYAPLEHDLQQRSGDRLTMSFREIEGILGRQLPPSARVYPPWWSNDATSHVQAHAWLRAGWWATPPDFGGEMVTFVREYPRRRAPDWQPIEFKTLLASNSIPDGDLAALLPGRSAAAVAVVRQFICRYHFRKGAPGELSRMQRTAVDESGGRHICAVCGQRY